MLRTTLLSVLVGLLALASLPAGAVGPAFEDVVSTVDGDTVEVTGTAIFAAADGPFEVGGSVTDFASTELGGAIGINLQSASVDVRDDGVEFVWQLEELGEVPPEGVRYTWAFTAGGQSFQLQAKRSNLVSVTTAEDPVGHANQAASGEDWFQLRGACQESYQGTPVSGCYHLAFLDGAFDDDANTVSMFMPFDTRDGIDRVVAAGFQPGTLIAPEETAGSSITATVQAGVSNTTTESYINGWDAFFAGRTVQAFVGKADTATPSFGQEWTVLDLDDDGSFEGSVTGVGGDRDTLHLRACATNAPCTTTSVPLG
ncbi:hypothetical protein DVS28_a1311 [Euzebya pacifica]|uniref:Uncharacterized protein n=1 Tax=Euzebya pacifica TaxID=1608957 RepID=A0A346XUW3_9ACTN|nr:hypothetical protein [Euzebya pacifica]AXV06010.1 hypothetical protein DVS28_a1311 [Euzebya pacifica]